MCMYPSLYIELYGNVSLIFISSHAYWCPVSDYLYIQVLLCYCQK
uniref:Uncharacterized protein n=1 Tax=Anguilla anguilla TaxID=7936 RepID=A0A0E9SCP3_ANGAN